MKMLIRSIKEIKDIVNVDVWMLIKGTASESMKMKLSTYPAETEMVNSQQECFLFYGYYR